MVEADKRGAYCVRLRALCSDQQLHTYLSGKAALLFSSCRGVALRSALHIPARVCSNQRHGSTGLSVSVIQTPATTLLTASKRAMAGVEGLSLGDKPTL